MNKSGAGDLIGAIICFLIAAMIMVAGFFVVKSSLEISNNEDIVTVNAVITEVEVNTVHYYNETRKEKTAYVEYEYDGVKYKSGLNVYTWGMREGKEIEILLDPEKPHDARVESEGIGIIVMVVMGVSFLSMGIYNVVLFRKNRKLAAEAPSELE